MKLIEEITKSIRELTSAAEMAKEANDIKTKKRLERRIAYLNECCLYLHTNPTDEFLIKEEQRLAKRINLLVEAFKPLDHLPKSTVSAMRKKYETEVGIPDLRRHYKNILFLLD